MRPRNWPQGSGAERFAFDYLTYQSRGWSTELHLRRVIPAPRSELGLRGGKDMRAGESSEATTTLAPASDADLVARAQRGEETAFTCLFEAHKRAVYSLCLRMTHSPSDAEDLTQEAFLQVFRKIATFRGDSSFSTWLHRLVVNAVLGHLRKRRAQVSLSAPWTSQEETITRQYRDDDRRLMTTIDRINLNEAIGDLPERYRTAVI